MITPTRSFENDIPARLRDRAGQIDGVIAFCIEGDGGGTWTVDGRHCTVSAGETSPPDFTVRMSSADWAVLAADPDKLMPLYFANRLRYEGNPVFGTKLKLLLR